MYQDPFSRCHPAVNFCFFLAVIGFGVVVQHPAYAAASLTCGCVYYLLLRGRQGLSFLFGLTGIMLAITLLNPLLNTSGRHILFRLLGRPYTLEALWRDSGGYFRIDLCLVWVLQPCADQR